MKKLRRAYLPRVANLPSRQPNFNTRFRERSNEINQMQMDSFEMISRAQRLFEEFEVQQEQQRMRILFRQQKSEARHI